MFIITLLEKETLTAPACFGRKKGDAGSPCESHVIDERGLSATGVLRKRDHEVHASLSGIVSLASFEAGNWNFRVTLVSPEIFRS